MGIPSIPRSLKGPFFLRTVDFPKGRLPIIRKAVFWGLYMGVPLILGNYQMYHECYELPHWA